MSFGISVGDLTVISKLVVDITGSFKSAPSEYQSLLHELQTFSKIIDHLKNISLACSTPDDTQELLRNALASCHAKLEAFLASIKMYDSSIGADPKANAFKKSLHKFRWGLEEQGEARKMQEFLCRYTVVINNLLQKLSVDAISTGLSTLATGQKRIEGVVDDTHSSVSVVQSTVTRQEGMLSAMSLSIPNMIYAIARDFRVNWERLVQMVGTVNETTEHIYAILVQIRDSSASIDTRHTWFQDPVVIEYPFGIKFPVPSEYGCTLMGAVVFHKFMENEYGKGVNEDRIIEMFYSDDPDIPIKKTCPLLPGRTIIAAPVPYHRPFEYWTKYCPTCHMELDDVSLRIPESAFSNVPDYRTECNNCGLYFDRMRSGNKATGTEVHSVGFELMSPQIYVHLRYLRKIRTPISLSRTDDEQSVQDPREVVDLLKSCRVNRTEESLLMKTIFTRPLAIGCHRSPECVTVPLLAFV
ncbi:hypothetical protein BS50DRAFT_583594 [Corynespora cassiicola Philippines]|uniref:Fungal N-terminal domain-containing protein n=1 Tax=Corynespora cassiicola Philippines TaxID=1448308 RepID=A0A2T2P387_CORCC|nr:hypothetical protein BS50DRAFT_583594 [Corynespora cassiicola Philippines]